MSEVRVYRDPEVLAGEAARLLLEEIRRHLVWYGRATVILPGGSTPRRTCAELAGLLAAGEVPLDRLSWVPGDERWVPPDHPERNERMIRETLLDPLGAGPERFLTWGADDGRPAERAAPEAAERFARRLQEHYAASPPGGGASFAETCTGLAVLGLGVDGHTASLFPDGQAVLPDGSRRPVSPDLPGLTAAVHRPAPDVWRLTLTPGFLYRACRIFFLAGGADKKESLRRVLNKDAALPASWLNREDTVFLVTRDTVDEARV